MKSGEEKQEIKGNEEKPKEKRGTKETKAERKVQFEETTLDSKKPKGNRSSLKKLKPGLREMRTTDKMKGKQEEKNNKEERESSEKTKEKPVIQYPKPSHKPISTQEKQKLQVLLEAERRKKALEKELMEIDLNIDNLRYGYLKGNKKQLKRPKLSPVASESGRGSQNQTGNQNDQTQAQASRKLNGVRSTDSKQNEFLRVPETSEAQKEEAETEKKSESSIEFVRRLNHEKKLREKRRMDELAQKSAEIISRAREQEQRVLLQCKREEEEKRRKHESQIAMIAKRKKERTQKIMESNAVVSDLLNKKPIFEQVQSDYIKLARGLDEEPKETERKKEKTIAEIRQKRKKEEEKRLEEARQSYEFVQAKIASSLSKSSKMKGATREEMMLLEKLKKTHEENKRLFEMLNS